MNKFLLLKMIVWPLQWSIFISKTQFIPEPDKYQYYDWQRSIRIHRMEIKLRHH